MSYYNPSQTVKPPVINYGESFAPNNLISTPLISLKQQTTGTTVRAADDPFNDLVLEYIKNQIILFVKNRILQILLAILGTLIYTIAILLMLVTISDRVANFLNTNMPQIYKMVSNIPLFVWTILAILSTGVMGLYKVSDKGEPNVSIQYWALIGIAVLLLYYSLAKKRDNKNCSQYLLTISALILIAYSILKMGLLTISLGFLTNLFSYSTMTVLTLITINHFVFLPNCKKE